MLLLLAVVVGEGALVLVVPAFVIVVDAAVGNKTLFFMENSFIKIRRCEIMVPAIDLLITTYLYSSLLSFMLT